MIIGKIQNIRSLGLILLHGLFNFVFVRVELLLDVRKRLHLPDSDVVVLGAGSQVLNIVADRELLTCEAEVLERVLVACQTEFVRECALRSSILSLEP